MRTLFTDAPDITYRRNESVGLVLLISYAWSGATSQDFLMCRECQDFAERFAIASRLYAEAAARVGTSRGTPLDYARLIAAAEDALYRSQDACAALKEHVSSHDRSAAAKPGV